MSRNKCMHLYIQIYNTTCIQNSYFVFTSIVINNRVCVYASMCEPGHCMWLRTVTFDRTCVSMCVVKHARSSLLLTVTDYTIEVVVITIWLLLPITLMRRPSRLFPGRAALFLFPGDLVSLDTWLTHQRGQCVYKIPSAYL